MDALHACNILQQLKALYDERQLTDIVVEVDHGKTFSCHRNVLAAISPYFRWDTQSDCSYRSASISIDCHADKQGAVLRKGFGPHPHQSFKVLCAILGLVLFVELTVCLICAFRLMIELQSLSRFHH